MFIFCFLLIFSYSYARISAVKRKRGARMNRTMSYSLIVLGSILYGIGTVLFIFPNQILLGGTSGIAVILAMWLPLTPGTFSVMLNLSLLIAAFLLLGKKMAVRTVLGSALTTLSIGALEPVFKSIIPVTSNGYLAAIIGAAMIAVASAIMFYVDSSSGGTDVLALIVQKYVKINIGKALFITDVLIVIAGGIITGFPAALSSILGFAVKVLGIDAVIYIIRRITLRKIKSKQQKE